MKNEPKNNLVFDKHWFAKHQRSLLWLANSWLGPLVFRFRKMGHHLVPGKRIVRLTPESVHQELGVRRTKTRMTGKQKRGILVTTFRAQFFSRNEYARKLYVALLPMWWAMHIWDWFVADHFQLAPQLSFGFSTLTTYSVDSTVSPCDGQMSYNSTGLTFGSIRTATGTAANASAGSPITALSADTTGQTDKYVQLARGIINFNTSALTSGATITNVVFSGWFIQKTNALGSPDFHIAGATPATTDDVVTGDYLQVQTTSFGNVTYANVDASNTAYTDITLNASGLAAINKTGVTSFSRQLSWDILNSTTGLTWGADLDSRFAMRDADFGPATHSPKLVVTYSTSTNWTKDLTDTVTITDTLAKATTRLLSEVATITDSILHSIIRLLSESTTISDVLTVLRVKVQDLTESFTASDSILRSMIKPLAEAPTITDLITKAHDRIVMDVATISDTLQKLADKALAEVIAITDSILRSITYVLSEVLTITDVLAASFTYLKTLSDSTTISDILSRAFTRVLTETITWADLTMSFWRTVTRASNATYNSVSRAVNDAWNQLTRNE